MTIDYAKMQREFPKQKAALTRAKKKGYAAVVETTRKTIAEWNETGAWPDDWAHWERTLEDSWWEARSKYLKDEIDEPPAHFDMQRF